VPITELHTSTNRLASCAKQCDLQTVVTSNSSSKKLHQLQEKSSTWKTWRKAAALRKAHSTSIREAASARLLEARSVHRKPSLDDTAPSFFPALTGEPKVSCSHFHLAANVEQLEQVFHCTRATGLGILPFQLLGFTDLAASMALCRWKTLLELLDFAARLK